METNSLEDLAKLNFKFESEAFHEPLGRTITWFFKSDECVAEWINQDLTVYRNETGKITGIEVNEKILDTERITGSQGHVEINSLEDLVNLDAKFESKPFHTGPIVIWFFEPDDCIVEWVNLDFTVCRSRETGKIVGIKVNDKILDTERRPRPSK